MALTLDSCVQYLKGIGPRRAEVLAKAGISSLEDILYHFPRRYEDRSHLVSIASLELGKEATVCAEIVSLNARRGFHRGVDILEVGVADDTGRIFCVWFNQPFLRRYFKIGERVILFGRAELYRDRIQMASPEFEIVGDEAAESLDINRIVPVYSLPQGISQKVFRKVAKAVLDHHILRLTEVLPFDIRNRHSLGNIVKSLINIHFPQNDAARLDAYNRLSFEEFFLYQIPLILRKLKRREKKGISFKIDDTLLLAFIKTLPFSLTDSQRKVLEEIKADMRAPFCMQRLLQGDVGSGKTIVAAIAALLAASCGYQAAFMAPTEILAQQHYEKLKAQLSTFSPSSMDHRPWTNIKPGLLTSSLKDKERQSLLRDIKDGKVNIVIGTHALIQEGVDFNKLGLIVVDEQHKFGVSQRALLSKKSVNPDCLIMTATPIPRTLSMTLYGDLDVSVISELPKGRKKIETKAFSLEEKEEAYEFVRTQVKFGRQAFVVCPLIEENPKLEISSAKAIYKEFSQKIFKDLKVGLIHGRLKRDEQEDVMVKFRQGELDILVATTILEVGIDVPNATVMLIEHAERFGLSQLHQMRGRIGRGEHASFCLLLAQPNTEDAQARIKVFVEESDGFKIAEEDLKIRGPGEFFGERQSGLTELKIADPLKQFHLLKSAREEATKLLNADPKLQARPNTEIKKQLYKRFPEFEKFMMVG
ncbi:MAG: ATP-dependent DNA helicase RecG [Candidatus Omnitrophica bacterium]|nr:ATP-dependent DNA helicase RecG [Candidatus Omnitrophota bacterium]